MDVLVRAFRLRIRWCSARWSSYPDSTFASTSQRSEIFQPKVNRQQHSLHHTRLILLLLRRQLFFVDNFTDRCALR